MKLAIRAVLTAAITVGLALCASAQAKTGQPATAQPQGGEKTVEEAYLQESAEALIITENAKGENSDRDSKLLALDMARTALDAGRKNADVRSALQYLALENTQVIVKSGGLGAVTNNFPDVRMRACEYLANFPSVETKDTLVKVILNSKTEDPMVLAEAIKSLGTIGINDNDEVVDAIAFSVNHFARVGMSEDRLAVYTMYAFLDLAKKGVVGKDMDTITKTIMNFTKGNYVSTVKKLATSVLAQLAQYQARSNSSGSGKK